MENGDLQSRCDKLEGLDGREELDSGNQIVETRHAFIRGGDLFKDGWGERTRQHTHSASSALFVYSCYPS